MLSMLQKIRDSTEEKDFYFGERNFYRDFVTCALGLCQLSDHLSRLVGCFLPLRRRHFRPRTRRHDGRILFQRKANHRREVSDARSVTTLPCSLVGRCILNDEFAAFELWLFSRPSATGPATVSVRRATANHPHVAFITSVQLNM
jgi:hypothetical protein